MWSRSTHDAAQHFPSRTTLQLQITELQACLDGALSVAGELRRALSVAEQQRAAAQRLTHRVALELSAAEQSNVEVTARLTAAAAPVMEALFRDSALADRIAVLEDENAALRRCAGAAAAA